MLDARETAPAAATPQAFLDKKGDLDRDRSVNGPWSAGIPGLPAALVHVAENYGRLPLARTLQPAIRIALVTLGVFSYRRLAIDMFPDVEIPVLSVITQFPGASPETVDVGQGEVAAGFAQGEGDHRGLACGQAGAVSAQGDGGRGGVSLRGVGGHADDVGVAHTGVGAVGVEVARRVAELEAVDLDGAGGGAARAGREGGGVALARALQVGQRPAGGGDISQREVAAGLT